MSRRSRRSVGSQWHLPLVHDRVPIPFASDVAVVMAGLVDAHGPKEMSAWMLMVCGVNVIPGVNVDEVVPEHCTALAACAAGAVATARPPSTAKTAPKPARRFVNSLVPIKAPFKSGFGGKRALLRPRAILSTSTPLRGGPAERREEAICLVTVSPCTSKSAPVVRPGRCPRPLNLTSRLTRNIDAH